MDQDKRQMRKLKRDLKRAGNRRRRNTLKRVLRDNPEDAHQADFDFGPDSFECFNGMDNDATRDRKSKSSE